MLPPANAQKPHCAAIIVAAGSSRRMGIDKLACQLHGSPVLQRTIDAFLAADSIDSIVVVCSENRWNSLAGNFKKPVAHCVGGAERQDSVAMGLAAVDPAARLVAVHDGARPLVNPSDINACVAAADEYRAVSLARRVTETLKRANDENFTCTAVDRENLWSMETPQVCETHLLRQALNEVSDRGLRVTDEVSALACIGISVKLIESRHPNLKITTPADLAVAEALLNGASTPRSMA